MSLEILATAHYVPERVVDNLIQGLKLATMR